MSVSVRVRVCVCVSLSHSLPPVSQSCSQFRVSARPSVTRMSTEERDLALPLLPLPFPPPFPSLPPSLPLSLVSPSSFPSLPSPRPPRSSPSPPADRSSSPFSLLSLSLGLWLACGVCVPGWTAWLCGGGGGSGGGGGCGGGGRMGEG